MSKLRLPHPVEKVIESAEAVVETLDPRDRIAVDPERRHALEALSAAGVGVAVGLVAAGKSALPLPLGSDSEELAREHARCLAERRQRERAEAKLRRIRRAINQASVTPTPKGGS